MAEALLSDEDESGPLVAPPQELTDRVADEFDLLIGAGSSDLGRGFRILAWLIEWMPLFMIGAFSRASRLTSGAARALPGRDRARQDCPPSHLVRGLQAPHHHHRLRARPGAPAHRFRSRDHRYAAAPEPVLKGHRSMNARELSSDRSVVIGRELTAAFDETCDVVVIGSGAGGAVMAALAEAGQRVIVLEEGPYYTPQEYGSFRPTESMRRIFREAGLLAAFGLGQTPVIGLSAGRCVGGSSVLTGGVCFRIPSELHRRLGQRSRPRRFLGGAFQDVVPRRRKAREWKCPAADALARDREVRRGSRSARHSDEPHAAQHRWLHRQRALQLRLPERGQDVGRRIVPCRMR